MIRGTLNAALLAGFLSTALVIPSGPARALTLEACQSRVFPFGVAIGQATRVLRDMADGLERLASMLTDPPASDRPAAREAHGERIGQVQDRVAGLQQDLDCWYGQMTQSPPPDDAGGVIDPQVEALCRKLAQAYMAMLALATADPDAAYVPSSLFPPPQVADRCPDPEEEES